MKRRTVLKHGGSASIVGLAGCIGGESGGQGTTTDGTTTTEETTETTEETATETAEATETTTEESLSGARTVATYSTIVDATSTSPGPWNTAARISCAGPAVTYRSRRWRSVPATVEAGHGRDD